MRLEWKYLKRVLMVNKDGDGEGTIRIPLQDSILFFGYLPWESPTKRGRGPFLVNADGSTRKVHRPDSKFGLYCHS